MGRRGSGYSHRGNNSTPYDSNDRDDIALAALSLVAGFCFAGGAYLAWRIMQVKKNLHVCTQNAVVVDLNAQCAINENHTFSTGQIIFGIGSILPQNGQVPIVAQLSKESVISLVSTKLRITEEEAKVKDSKSTSNARGPSRNSRKRSVTSSVWINKEQVVSRNEQEVAWKLVPAQGSPETSSFECVVKAQGSAGVEYFNLFNVSLHPSKYTSPMSEQPYCWMDQLYSEFEEPKGGSSRTVGFRLVERGVPQGKQLCVLGKIERIECSNEHESADIHIGSPTALGFDVGSSSGAMVSTLSRNELLARIRQEELVALAVSAMCASLSTMAFTASILL